MSKRFKRLRENSNLLPVNASDAGSELPELKKEEEEELKKAVAEADELAIEEDGVGTPADDNAAKSELPEDEDLEGEVKTEAEEVDGDEKIEEESEEDFEVDLSDLEEDDAEDKEVKTESEDKEDEVKTESDDADEDDKVVSEEDEKDDAKLKTESEEDDKMAKLRAMKEAEEDDKIAIESAEEILAKEDELPADLKERARTIIEATVNSLVKRKLVRKNKKLKESYLKKLREIHRKTKGFYESKLDKYSNYVVENWMNENAIAIESSLKVQLAEKVLNSVKKTLVESSVVIPENKVNLVTKLQAQVAELNEALEKQIDANQDLHEKVSEFDKVKIIDDASKDLSLEQKTRLERICENVSFESSEKFAKKVAVLKENYISKKTVTKAKDLDSRILNEGGIKSVSESQKGKYSDAAELLTKTLR